jgi:hypothetical protein
MHPIIMGARGECVPFTGHECLHLAVHDLHGHGVLVIRACQPPFGAKGVGEWEQHTDEKGHGYEQLDQESAALAPATGGGRVES